MQVINDHTLITMHISQQYVAYWYVLCSKFSLSGPPIQAIDVEKFQTIAIENINLSNYKMTL